ncbi:MAG: hypothetical protein GY759_05530 [Chloroflexi bacterium]|nr:hypothetical protein [Chloroflexota bacterium]
MPYKTIRIFVWVILISALVTACAQPLPTPEPQPRPQAATPAVVAESPTPLPPTATLPALDLPPVIVSTSPERGEEQPLAEPILVIFDQAMDAASTGAAFSLEPAAPGEVQVDANTLRFTPSRPLPRGASFRMAVDERAKAVNGKALASPIALRFNTVGYLEVTSSQPADGSLEVSVDSPITVIFNRPVVPLTSVGQMADLPHPLLIDPSVPGQGEWLNTSIYRFQPLTALAGASDYVVTIAAGLEDTTGGLLAEDHIIRFRTADPILLGFEPEGNQVSPSTAITVTFSQPMDVTSTEAAFDLRHIENSATVSVPGLFTWLDQHRTLKFQPDKSLDYGEHYTVVVTDSARSAEGAGALRDWYTAGFQVAPIIGVSSSKPSDGASDVPPESDLEISFNGIVDQKTLGKGALTILPEPTGVYTYFSSYNNLLTANWPLTPRTVYDVILSQDIGDIFGNTLGNDYHIRFSTGDRKPFAHINLPGNDAGTYNAYNETLIPVSYRNISRLDFKLYQVPEQDIARLLGRDRWQGLNEYAPRPNHVVRTWSVEVDAPLNENVLQKIALAEEGGPLAAGVYWLEMRAPEIEYTPQQVPRHLLIVSPLNLIIKKGAQEMLVWATDLRSGQPVPDLPIRVEGAASARGITGADGIFHTPFRSSQPWDPLIVFAGEPDDASYAVASSEWQQGLSPWDFGLQSEFSPAAWFGHIYTDRPIYRPGQTLYWKTILRQDDDASFQVPPAGTQLEVIIKNSQGNEIYNAIHETNAFGTINGALPLPEEAGLGFYNLQVRFLHPPANVSHNPTFSYGFQVAEYRKPEFEIDLTTDHEEYLQDDTVNATLSASYFFGGPVADAGVAWTVFSEDAYFNFADNGGGRWYSFNDYSGWDSRQTQRYGETLTSGTGQTDSQGQFTFSIPADIGDRTQSQRFIIDVRITDLNNQEVATNTSVLVHKGLIYPGISPRDYVTTASDSSEIDLIAVDWESQPLPNRDITVVVSRAKWNTVQEKADNGQFYWVTRVEETPLISETVTTDASGEALFSWRPDSGGQYKISAIVEDDLGNDVRSSAFVWVSDQPGSYASWRVENNDRIELVADKRLYQVGDTAKVLVPHPYQGDVQALVTIERAGILDVRQITLHGNSETLEIPIDERFVPNAYVSVVLVKGQGERTSDLGSFKLGIVELPVDTAPKELDVTLTPSQPLLEPGAEVTFTVDVRDTEGAPVQGEFSLALVDKALLSLTSGQERTLLDTFYRKRGLGIFTASSLVLNIDRLNQQLQEGAKGGGGGGGDGGLSIRSDFEDTALWEPALVTDANGRAEITVILPDNLTTWRLHGRGITMDTKVGEATAEIVTSLPLLLRPVLPRFFTSGDQAEIGAIVNNNTEVERDVQVELQVEGLTTNGALTQQISIPAGGQIKVTWQVSVPPPDTDQAVGDAVVRFTAVEIAPPKGEDPLGDGLELNLPIYRYSSPETVGTAGKVALGEERTEVIVLPPNVDPTQGDLRIRLEPSLAAGMIESLDWLEHFPYECNEQIISKFLPNVETYRALAELGIDSPDIQDNLGEQIDVAVHKLLQRQNADGGWGWFGGDPSQPFISSYVLFGLVEAQKIGLTIDPQMLDDGIAYVQHQLKPVDDLRGYKLNQQAFMLYVLAEAGESDIGRTVSLYDVRERLGHYGRAYLALAFGKLVDDGEPTAQVRLQQLVDDLKGDATLSASGAHWQEESVDWWTMNTDTRSTSLALTALARFDPDNGLTPNVVRWLMVARKAGRWETTQESVWAIIGLTDFMVATQELKGDYSYQVTLNGGDLAEGVVTPDTVGEPIDLRVAVQDLLLDHANALTIARFAEPDQTGAGQLYYTSHLNYFLPASDLEALDRGIVVAREYTLVDDPERVIDTAQVGDTIDVQLTLIAPSDLHYLVLESPLPAGAEAIDPSLATTSQIYEGPELRPEVNADSPWFWYWQPTQHELRDEKVVLFATELAAGTYIYRYQMRAGLSGEFQTLPAMAYEMYFPEVWGRSAGEVFSIQAD